jgi:hypothetical protein
VARTASKGRDELTESIDFVTREREIIVFRNDRNGKPIAALVPVDDDELLEALEEQIDVREARQALQERSIPWEEVKKTLGL